MTPHEMSRPDPPTVEAGAHPVIEARGIRKSFGDTEVLHGVDLSVARGEVVVIIGPSGSGKSTFLRTLNHLDRPDAGRIRINGLPLGFREQNGREEDVSDATLARQRRQIGMVFQQFNLFAHLTVLQNVICGPVEVVGSPRAAALADAKRLLARVGLSDKEDFYPAELSGGQQQRVAIARALAMHPAAMLFDEPTSALDPETVGEVLAVMQDLAAKGMTMVIVTHEIQFARNAADRILFMEDGRIVEEGRPADLVDGPGHDPRYERTRRFLRLVTHAA
jgi:polar amino acid transport system ATP-binding protein